ncbi:MAG TPA: hypothetical protein VM577_16610, partial [Anaerovoracaceae bacterium]|nr:hypothetical protein [Anaerovoracaceae bacterium]
MAKKLYENLVKPVTFREGPKGLYPNPIIWMEGKDMEGFEANIAYTFIKEPCTMHPVKNATVHPYDELLVFGGLDPKDIFYLGGEVSIELGEEREEYIFAEPTVICIPKGTPHGPVKIRRVSKPFAHYSCGLSPEYKATEVILKEKGEASYGTKYAHMVKKIMTHIDAEIDASGMGYRAVT